MNYLRTIRHIFIFFLPVVMWGYLFISGYMYAIKIEPVTSQLNLLPICLFLSFVYLTVISRKTKVTKFILGIVTVGFLLLSWDKKLHEDIKPYKEPQGASIAMSEYSDLILQRVKDYRHIAKQIYNHKKQNELSEGGYYKVEKIINDYSKDTLSPLDFLLSRSLISLNSMNLVNKINIPKSKKVELLWKTYNALNYDYDFVTFELRYDYDIEMFKTLGIMTNKKLNKLHELTKTVKNNPKILASNNIKMPMSYLAINPFISNEGTKASLTMAGISVFESIYINDARFKESIIAFEEDRYDEFWEQRLKKHNESLENDSVIK